MTISTDVYISLSLVFGNLYKSIRGFLFLVIGSIVRSSRTRYPLSCSVWKGKNTCFEIQCCKYDVSIRHACIDVGAIAFIGDSNTQCGDEMRLHVNTTNVQSSLATHSYRCVCMCAQHAKEIVTGEIFLVQSRMEGKRQEEMTTEKMTE